MEAEQAPSASSVTAGFSTIACREMPWSRMPAGPVEAKPGASHYTHYRHQPMAGVLAIGDMRWQDLAIETMQCGRTRRQQGGGGCEGGGLPIGGKGRLILLVVVMVARGYCGVDLGLLPGSAPPEPAPASQGDSSQAASSPLAPLPPR